MRFLFLLLVVAIPSIASADAWDEFNEWRRRAGLPEVVEDPAMRAFAERKARYRAERGLKDGHDGPSPSPGWREGTGEATADWGWLTCCQEESATHGGAGLCIGRDGERYMVLVLRGGSGRPLIPRNNIPIFDTSYLTPDPPRVERVRFYLCPRCGRFH